MKLKRTSTIFFAAAAGLAPSIAFAGDGQFGQTYGRGEEERTSGQRESAEGSRHEDEEDRFARPAVQRQPKRMPEICRQRMQQLSATETTERQVSGRVVATKLVSLRGTRTKNQIALIETMRGNRRLVVDLGPASALEELEVSKGDKIRAEGVVRRIGDRDVLIAARLRVGGKIAEIDRTPQMQQHRTMLADRGRRVPRGVDQPKADDERDEQAQVDTSRIRRDEATMGQYSSDH